jgi:TonB-dependent SusC/RagA subfamily outer membrane receptor
MKTILLFFTFIFCIRCGAFAQSDNYALNIADKLKKYFSTYDPEKAYLQFDRPFYAAGDTIYFKAYVTQGGNHKLSDVSGVLHVDFINSDKKIDQSINLRLDSGVCWGDFALPDSLLPGNYRIRAYTNWMLNAGQLDFFDQTIPVGSFSKPNVSNSLAKRPTRRIKEKADIQFFPEGGILAEGIRTKVAFKAIGTNGLAINVKGVLLDKENKQVCPIESSHLGMGYFVFYPGKDNSYKAKLSFTDGSQDTVYLMKPETSGISLSVNNDSISTISIRIKANDVYYKTNKNKDFLLVIYSGGKTITYPYQQDDPVITLDMGKKVIQSGVATITLFSQDGEPLCERLFFVQNNDQLRLQIQTEKPSYRKKEKVNLLLNAKNTAGLSVDGHFSMTIINESKISASENSERNILTNLLLTSNLSGYVEQPNYYFKDTSEETRRNLDVLMLTQGYRDFEWKQVLNNETRVLTFQPEKGLNINGKITNLSNQPVPLRSVNMVPSNGGQLLSTTSDSKGFFQFSNLVFTDTVHVVLSVVNSEGDKTTNKITYLKANYEHPMVPDLPYILQSTEDSSMHAYLEKEKKNHNEYIDNDPGKFKLLNPVTVKTVVQDNQYKTQNIAGAGFADQILHADEFGQTGGQLSETLNGRLHGITFVQGIPFIQSHMVSSPTESPQPMLLILDGAEIKFGAAFSIDDIPTTQVETVEVLKYASTGVYGMNGANGVLIITTREGNEVKKGITALGVLPVTPMGFYKARTFYSPKYNYANGNNIELEMRPTIYWNPEIKTDKDGNASLEYYNAESRGIYKVIVEGIDKNGNIGRLVYRYKVE